MSEPWDIKRDDTRLSDFLPTFIIFCEDEVSERVYFKYFETSKIKVNPIGGQRSKMEHVIKAIAHCISEELMEYSDSLPVLKVEGTQVWCVFDRDIEEQESKQTIGDISFNEAIDTATARGLQVAWSNDAFELWILLHFKEIDPLDDTSWERSKYYDQLTTIFKTMPHPNEYLSKALLHRSFNYKQDLKQEKNFRNIVRAAIVAHTHQAIVRAKKLEQYHAVGLPNHKKVPCTLVYHLVEELIKWGGKKV